MTWHDSVILESRLYLEAIQGSPKLVTFLAHKSNHTSGDTSILGAVDKRETYTAHDITVSSWLTPEPDFALIISSFCLNFLICRVKFWM